MPRPDDPLLSGAFEPLRVEHDIATLEVEGVIPAGLHGVLYRIGPNPQFEPIQPYNPLQGDGMVHAFRIAGGRVSYRNRWVRTRQWRLERAAGRALFSTADPRLNDPAVAGEASDGVANTNILMHAGRLLALEEGHAPIAMRPGSLETLGPFDFAGVLPGPMTAHPKVDPLSGEMIAFANFPTRRFDGALALYVIDRAGEIAEAARIEGPWPAMVHDFAITASHVVFVVCPVTLSLERIRSGAPAIAWEPALGARVGVVARANLADGARWFDAHACMAWHMMNAFDDGGAIRIDLCEQAAPAFPTPDGRPNPDPLLQQRLARWTIDLGGGSLSVERLSETVCEYPRIDERRTGLPYRYGFVAAEGGPGTGDMSHRAIGRFDHETGALTLWRPGAGQAVSEPVFVAARPNAPEGVGWLLATVFDEASDASHLAVLDAERVDRGPLARARLGHRVPAGFHGSFAA